MSMFKKTAVFAAFFLLLPPLAWAEVPKAQPSLAMTGTPLYPADFDHFAYTNPTAPKGGFLRLGATGTFDSLNPFIVRGNPPFGLSTGSMSLIYETLMSRGWDEPFTLYGLIAETIEVPEDRSSITFNLNKAAHFSDGTPITTEDVQFSFEILRDKGRPNHRTYYKKVAFVEKLSDSRIKFTFKRNDVGIVDREMPLIMALMPIVPKHDWADRDFNQTSLRVPVGSGPYKITLVDLGRSITYERDPAYWGRDLAVMRGLFNFNKIRVDYYRDDSVSLQAFKAGQYDLRRENDPTKWATAYDTPAVDDGRIRLEKLEHHRTEPAYGFIFNTRRPLLANAALRAALEYSFDFAWVNKNLFHGKYKHVDSFFPNSELAATGLPEGKELEILNTYRSQLPPEIFTTAVTPPEAKGEEAFREQMVKAEAMLHAAGFTTKDDQLYTAAGVPVTFEIMLSDPTEEKVALNWAHDLKRLGITATIHTVDSAQYQSRLASFDYDIIANKWFNSLSPGNEQLYYWGSTAADQKGSRNYAGVKNPVIDGLAAAIVNTKTREDLVATTRALDRVLMQGHYTIPLYYMGADTIASWTKIRHPETMSLYGNIMESWWSQ